MTRAGAIQSMGNQLPGSTAPVPRRARSVAEMSSFKGGIGSAAARAAALAFRPRPTDVIIATYPKCGTTWLQQIVHGLRTRGSMDFDEITLVVPWLELALDLGIDPDAPQATEPRAFKSHLSWDEVPKGGRYITMVRDPKDVLVSMYHFHEGWRFEAGSITMEDYARNFFLAPERSRRYWRYVASWWPRRGREDVLVLSYEGALADVPGTVRRIARFIGCALDDALLDVVVRQSSIDFMKAHGSQFDDHVVRDARNAAAGLPPGGSSSKLRNGRVGDHVEALPMDVRRTLDGIWREEMEGPFGLAAYRDLLAALGPADGSLSA